MSALIRDSYKVYDYELDRDVICPAWYDINHEGWCIVCCRNHKSIWETQYNYIILRRVTFYYPDGRYSCDWRPIDSEEMNRYLCIFRREGEVLGSFTLSEAKYLLPVAQIGMGAI